MPSAVILVVDKLGTSHLPPYGNTLIDAPNFNHIASESLLFDFAFSDSPELLTAIGSLWYPTHATSKEQGSADLHLASVVADSGAQTVLLTDDPIIANDQLASQFDRVIHLQVNKPSKGADSVGESWLASFFGQALETVTNLEPGTLLWIHCSGLSGPWDAPYEYRQQLAHEEDPDPPTSIEPPVGRFNPKDDSPDVQLGYQQAYSAQLKMLDEFLGIFFESIQSLEEPTLFSLLSTRGYPLGEHERVGETSELYCESIHVPLMIRWPDERARASRVPSLVQTGSMYHLLKHWFTADDQSVFPFSTSLVANKSDEFVLSVCDGQEAIQTHAWKLIRKSAGEESVLELFKKPDDRWEVNDVFDRCPHIAPAMVELLNQSLKRLGEGDSTILGSGSPRMKIGEQLTT